MFILSGSGYLSVYHEFIALGHIVNGYIIDNNKFLSLSDSNSLGTLKTNNLNLVLFLTYFQYNIVKKA